MLFKCEKASLQEAINTAQKAVTGKSTMPILEGLLITARGGRLIILGSDIDLCIESKIDAHIEEEGSIVVDCKLFGELIRKLPNDEVTIKTIENNSIEITCQKSKSTLIYMRSDDYPSLPEINQDIKLTVSQKLLKNMIKGTIFAVAQEETRPILTGVLFEVKDKTLNLVALDGLRVALRSEKIDCESDINVVIPGKSLSEISKILQDNEEGINITFTHNHILFNLGDVRIISRLLEGEFIKYASILPKEYNLQIRINKSELLDCIERASLMAKEGKTNLVKLDLEEDVMVITSNSQLGKAREELNIIMQGEALQIAFNSKYIIDVLKIMEEEEIIMEFASSVSPCIVKNTENDNCTYLILPVRILR